MAARGKTAPQDGTAESHVNAEDLRLTQAVSATPAHSPRITAVFDPLLCPFLLVGTL